VRRHGRTACTVKCGGCYIIVKNIVYDGKVVLVDYKTTSPRNVPGVKERYSVQMDIYRKAIVSATGLEVKEAYLYLTNLGLTVDM
jgi:ATP-dependent helicase/nuclease subunit A